MHFLSRFLKDRSLSTTTLGKRRACVDIRFERPNVLRVVADRGVSVLKMDAELAPLPDTFVVLDSDGKRIRSTGQFYVSTETIDPWHALTDVF